MPLITSNESSENQSEETPWMGTPKGKVESGKKRVYTNKTKGSSKKDDYMLFSDYDSRSYKESSSMPNLHKGKLSNIKPLAKRFSMSNLQYHNSTDLSLEREGNSTKQRNFEKSPRFPKKPKIRAELVPSSGPVVLRILDKRRPKL